MEYASALFIAYCALLYSSPVYPVQTLVLNTAVSAPVSNESQTGFADRVRAEALRRAEYKLQTVHMPAERALTNANRGIDDGDLVRVAGLQKKHDNHIPVPESVMSIDMVLFSKNMPGFKVEGLDSVESYSFAIISDWKITGKNFKKLADKIEIIKTDNAEQSFTLLMKNRVDFVAYSSGSGLNYLKTRDIKNVKLLAPPLPSPLFYVNLHKKHKEIVPKLVVELKKNEERWNNSDVF